MSTFLIVILKNVGKSIKLKLPTYVIISGNDNVKSSIFQVNSLNQLIKVDIHTS